MAEDCFNSGNVLDLEAGVEFSMQMSMLLSLHFIESFSFESFGSWLSLLY